eukprot:s1452_g1.t1
MVFNEGYQTTWNEARAEVQQNRALAIAWSHMEETHRRVREEYRIFSRHRRQVEGLDEQRDAAISVCRRALLESVEHADMCPMSDLVWEMNGFWHAQPQCEQLPAHHRGAPRYGTRGSPVSVLRPCPTCSTGMPTPHLPDARGRTLLQDLERWITDQGFPSLLRFGLFASASSNAIDVAALCRARLLPLGLAESSGRAGVIYHFQLSVEPVIFVPGYASTEDVSVQVDPSPLQMTFRQPLLVIRTLGVADIENYT